MSAKNKQQNLPDQSAGWNLENSYSSLPNEFYSDVRPTTVQNPSLVILNQALATDLGFDAQALMNSDQVAVLAGNRVVENSRPIAQAYAGHQFGGFTNLGDGRAILLGEQLTPSGLRLDVQLKGCGPTPYSRRGDGRASLGPMLREYIISQAMQSLGIPTTLSLAVVQTGEPVYRYQVEPGAVLTRIASSHIRVGTFQFAAARSDSKLVKHLAYYTIRRHYSHLQDAADSIYLGLLKTVIERQAKLVAQWMQVGFIHGVMNTDNVSIAGETIDYGPCAFLNVYSPCTVFSSIDEQGRYSFGNQPGICQWNLARFAETLLPLLDVDMQTAIQMAMQAIGEFPDTYRRYWLAAMRGKLGLSDAREIDQELVESLLAWMESQQRDYTVTFRDLAMGRLEQEAYQDPQFVQWLSRWRQRLESSGISGHDASQLMQQHNPAVIARNHRVEQALAAAVERQDFRPLQMLLQALSRPYDELPENEDYRLPSPDGDAGYRTFCGT